MPIQRFRGVESMPGPSPRSPGDPDNLRLAFEWSMAALALSGAPFRPGVYPRDLREPDPAEVPVRR